MPVSDSDGNPPGDDPVGDSEGLDLGWSTLKKFIPGAAVLAMLGDLADNGKLDTSTGVVYEVPEALKWLKEFFVDPVGFIIEAILTFIVGGILTIAEIAIGAVQAAFEPFKAIPGIISGAVADAAGPVADALLWLPLTLEDLATDLAAELGPWAVFVLVPLAVGLTVGLYYGLTWGIKLLSPRIAALVGVD